MKKTELEKESGKISGYAYTGAFKGRAAYDWAVETSIFIRQGCHGQGIGKGLYRELERYTKEQQADVIWFRDLQK